MRNNQVKIMVVPAWFGNDAESIRALAEIEQYYHPKTKHLFQTTYLWDELQEGMRLVFALEGILQKTINQIPHHNYYHCKMIDDLNEHLSNFDVVGTDENWLTNKLKSRKVMKGFCAGTKALYNTDDFVLEVPVTI